MAQNQIGTSGLNALDANQVIKKSTVVLSDGTLATQVARASGTDFSATSGVTPLAVATPTLVKAAGTTGIKNYVTSAQFYNTSATVSTTVSILDGSTILWTGFLPATTAALPVVAVEVEFLSPLRGTAATTLNIQLGTTLASVYYNLQGFQGF